MKRYARSIQVFLLCGAMSASPLLAAQPDVRGEVWVSRKVQMNEFNEQAIEAFDPYSKSMITAFAGAPKECIDSLGLGNEMALGKCLPTANAGDVASMIVVGDLYSRMLDEDAANATEMQKWFEKAAASGSSYAAYRLGILFAEGQGAMKADIKRAIDWLKKSEAKGDEAAALSLGAIYMSGKSGRPKEALPWLQKAASSGLSNAYAMLGDMYWRGHGVPQDTKRAQEYLDVAATAGNVDAQYKLGLMLMEGNRDEKGQAMVWLALASRKGHFLAPVAARNLKKQLSNEDYQTVVNIVENWVPMQPDMQNKPFYEEPDDPKAKGKQS